MGYVIWLSLPIPGCFHLSLIKWSPFDKKYVSFSHLSSFIFPSSLLSRFGIFFLHATESVALSLTFFIMQNLRRVFITPFFLKYCSNLSVWEFRIYVRFMYDELSITLWQKKKEKKSLKKSFQVLEKNSFIRIKNTYLKSIEDCL